LSRIGVIIPFYRQHGKLARCLAHLRAQSHPDIEIFVRDNTDDNVYFTAAVNEGLKKFSCDSSVAYVVVLNQDAYLAPDALRSLVDFMESNPGSGIACPVQQTAQGTLTWCGSLRAWPAGEHRREPPQSGDEPIETYWANGAAQMIRCEVVREVGLWDRNLRFICSDADFSFRARALGWKVHVVPAARCEHSLGSSAGDPNPQVELIKLRDGIYFARKWLNGDLYRSLSFEGSSLLRLGVNREIDNMERMAAEWERILAG
jgi:GT2 family glycosyltransferase